MQILQVDPITDPIWQHLVDRVPSSVFHSPAWLKVLHDTYGIETGGWVLCDSLGTPGAGLPFCRISDMVGERIVSLPFSDYCDPLVGDEEQWNCLIGELLAERWPIIVRCLHSSLPRADQRFALVKEAKWHGVDLHPDVSTLWARLHPSSRRAIAKAHREGVIVRAAQGAEDLQAFFALHLKLRKYKYRLLAQPFRFFENIWRQFIVPGDGVLLLAIYRDTIIGGVLFLKWKDTLYYKFNASAASDLAYRPNDLLMWEGIQYAKAQNCSYLDFGLSDLDQEGLVRYKRKYATEEKVISFLRCAPNEIITQQQKQLPNLLSQLTDLFTDESAPDSLTDKAGEILYRFFA